MATRKTTKKFTYSYTDKPMGEEIKVSFTGEVLMDKKYLPDYLTYLGECASDFEGRLLSLEAKEV